MKNSALMDLYSDYLLTSFKFSTAVGMSKMLDGNLSHDQISRFLAQDEFTQKDYWRFIKPIVRSIEQAEAVICVDDFIVPKPHSTMNDMINYHFDHSSGENIKGINILSFVYHTTQTDVQLPIAFEIVTKPDRYIDKKTGKEKRRSEISKNELFRQRLSTLTQRNHVPYAYVLFDTWFCANENLQLIHEQLKKFFVTAIKANRKVALSEQDKLRGKFHHVNDLDLQPASPVKVWIKGLSFEVLLCKHIYTNIDGSTGVLYLISNDMKLTNEELPTIYHKRWKVEEFHKSAKQNASLGQSPTKYELTQSNHIFCSMISVCKLELLKIKSGKNHFAIKSHLYIKAVKAAFEELQWMKLHFKQLNLPFKPAEPLLALQ